MSSGDQGRNDCYEVVQRAPLVVVGVVEQSADVRRLAEALATHHPDVEFVGVMTADEGDDLGSMLETLAPHVAEMIFTAATSGQAIAGWTLADRALNEHGVGQDFVFTVPVLIDAIPYALDALGDRAWEGTALLVPGARATIDEVRSHLRSTR